MTAHSLPPPDFPLPAYVRRADSRLLMPDKTIRAVLPGLMMPAGLMGGSTPLTEVTVHTSQSDTNSTFTLPATIQAGDFLVLLHNRWASTTQTAIAPSGWTQITTDQFYWFVSPPEPSPP